MSRWDQFCLSVCVQTLLCLLDVCVRVCLFPLGMVISQVSTGKSSSRTCVMANLKPPAKKKVQKDTLVYYVESVLINTMNGDCRLILGSVCFVAVDCSKCRCSS